MSEASSHREEITKVYPVEFLVTAEDWQEVIRIFNETLGIDTGKQDSSDRQIKGQYLVRVGVDETKLVESFYDSVKQSDVLAIINDPTSLTRRDVVLSSVYQVETQLRRLLLHVNDIVGEFYEYFKNLKNNTDAKTFANKEKVIDAGELDPMTSHLTFDEIIKILDQDLATWDKRELTANDLLDLLGAASNIEDLKKSLQGKIQKKPIWSLISKHVLETQVSWDDLRIELDQLKHLRNKAAHFQVITPKDEANAKRLTSSIISKIKRQKLRLTEADLATLKKSSETLVESFEDVRKAIESMSIVYKNNLSGLAAVSASLGQLQGFSNSTLGMRAVDLGTMKNFFGVDGSGNGSTSDGINGDEGDKK